MCVCGDVGGGESAAQKVIRRKNISNGNINNIKNVKIWNEKEKDLEISKTLGTMARML